MESYRPKLQNASSASQRIDALCEFIEFWLGPRHPDFGEPREAVDDQPLPMPLKRLYEFAGRWPNLDHSPSEYVVPAFSHQDYLVLLDRLEYPDEDKVIFLGENQDVWNCRTLSHGDDPPVWCYGDLTDEDGEWIRGERQVCDSLSRFLTTFILQELVLGSKLHVCDESLQALFDSQRKSATPLWLNGPYVHGSDQDYYLWGDVLVANIWGGGEFYFAANRDTGIAFLSENQGPIHRIDVTMHEPWRLEVRDDGSAQVRYLRGDIDEMADVPPGTMQFASLVDQMSRAASEEGHWDRNAMVAMFRKGQHGGVRCKHLHNGKMVSLLFRFVLDRAVNRNKALEERFATEWPLA